MNENFRKLKDLLTELFQLDAADLDFGIYRIMNQKRDEIVRFLEHDLLPQVRETLQASHDTDVDAVSAELRKLEETLTSAGVDPSTSPKVQEFRARLAQVDITGLENEVFSHLTNFFRRYYSEGDFISLRRYKPGVYAIPYEGEEVKLHWANADQYYIKTSEYFRDYTFTLPSGKRAHFRLAEADTERDNNRGQNGNERRFILSAEAPMLEENDELIIRFEYRQDEAKRKQADLNTTAAQAIMAATGFAEWQRELASLAPTESNPRRTQLEKHLTGYTARNTFDYFIHKNLNGFLRRELDFFIKNEVVRLDDIEEEDAPRVEQYLAKVKALRRIGHKIIAFIAQIEDFQKRLWLKKKFVVDTNYCVTLDRVPEALYPQIIVNIEQIAEWKRLFAIEEIPRTLENPGFSDPITIDFLNANNKLLLDTRFYNEDFKACLISSLENMDELCDGLLIHSDNFQALNLLQPRYYEQVKCIYIDPPYNTNSSSIPYKNNYRHSSWGTLMHDRLALLQPMLKMDGAIFVSIDKTERTILEHVLDLVFGADNRVEELIWSMNTNNSQAPNYSTNHEYVEVYARDRRVAEQDRDMFREPKPGFEEVMALVAKLNPSYPSIDSIERELRSLYERHRIEYRETIESQGLEWEDEKGNDPWKGLFNYNRAEYRNGEGRFVPESEAKERNANIWVWQEGDASMPATKQAASTSDSTHPNWRYYKPIHPQTGKPCPHPKSGWKFAYADDDDSPDRRSFVSLDRDHRIAWGPDEKKVPRLKRMLHEVETNVGKSVFQDYSDGEKQTSAMFGQSGVFLAPKHADFVSRFIVHACNRNSLVVDCFGGTGSTAHAVIKLNRDDHGTRKYLLAEVGNYFDTVLKPRVLKAAYSSDWKGGKPVSRDGISQCIKYLRLESYEDTLNNLALSRTSQQDRLLDVYPQVLEEYLLQYVLDVESRGSASLLNIAAFEDPFNYKLNISTGSVGETKPTPVDLIETFNYLLGLHVKHVDTIRGFRVVQGTNPRGERVLVIWRNVKEQSSANLEAFFLKQGYNTLDMEFDLIYVNGDNHLENLRREDETWKVRLIDEEFQRLMFDVEDV